MSSCRLDRLRQIRRSHKKFEKMAFHSIGVRVFIIFQRAMLIDMNRIKQSVSGSTRLSIMAKRIAFSYTFFEHYAQLRIDFGDHEEHRGA